MITQEDLAKHIRIATQNAWRQDNGGGTTINSMVEYIIKESLAVVMEIILEQESRIEALEADVSSLENLVITLTGNNDDGKDGGLSQPQGNPKSTSRTNARNGTSSPRK